MRENDTAKLFEKCQRELVRLADLIKASPALEDTGKVETAARGAVLGAALIGWLKDRRRLSRYPKA